MAQYASSFLQHLHIMQIRVDQGILTRGGPFPWQRIVPNHRRVRVHIFTRARDEGLFR